jgi:hypothetical protein
MAITISSNTRKLLETMRLRGSIEIPIKIGLSVSNEEPFIGEKISVSWITTDTPNNLVLLINGAVTYRELDGEGSLLIPISKDEELVIQLADNHITSDTIVVKPMVITPKIEQFSVSQGKLQAFVEERLELDWETTDTARVKLIIDYGEPNMLVIDLPTPSGKFGLPSLAIGTHHFRLQSFSLHEEVSDKAFTERRATIDIIETPPSFTHLVYSKNIDIEQCAELRWQAHNAEEVILKWPDGEEYLPAQGHISFYLNKLGVIPLTLWASGSGGQTKKSLQINVESTPATAQLQVDKTSIQLGESIKINWQLSGGIKHAELKLNEFESMPISQKTGCAQITPVSDSLITLHAEGHEGITVTKKVQVVLTPFLL